MVNINEVDGRVLNGKGDVQDVRVIYYTTGLFVRR